MSDTRYISCADTAKLIRQALKEAFPEVKFSVKSKNYSGGASIGVGWTDGPLTADVDPMIKVFAGTWFDGMDDSTHYYETTLNGERVHFCSSFVFSNHHISEDRIAALVTCLEQAGKDWWLTVCSDMGHPFPRQAVSNAFDARDLAYSILRSCPSSQWQGRKSALVETIRQQSERSREVAA